jgi:large subunit ribosomal protein L13
VKTLRVREHQRRWYLIDAKDRILGRVAVKAATLLRGKHKPEFTPNVEGDWVVVVNAASVRVTGRKLTDKLYRRHSGYPGGLKSESLGNLLARRPTVPLEQAVRGMLPHGRLGRKLFGNLRVYAGASHPHDAQHPEKVEA